MDALFYGVLAGAILSCTSVLYATVGEVIVERAGIVSLGLEGVMLIGASVAFAVTYETGNATIGLLAAGLAAGLFNSIFGFLVVSRKANQLASGLALMFLGTGLSALIGKPYVGKQIEGFQEIRIPVLSDLPVVGGMFFNHDPLVYLVGPVTVLAWWVLFRTRWGLRIRSLGENPVAAFAAGVNPVLLKYEALLLAGVLGGVGGAHLSIAFTKTWVEAMTSGRGFIAVAIVIFSVWHPLRAIAGALLFGGAIALQLQLQARGVPVSPFLMDMLPYLLTLLVLVLWGGRHRYSKPAWLGRNYEASR